MSTLDAGFDTGAAAGGAATEGGTIDCTGAGFESPVDEIGLLKQCMI